jgi:flagellar basal-body rod protein FlgB
MVGALFNSTTVPVLEQVVGFTQARHAVLAGNVANADTPGYRVRDLSVGAFQAQLKEAIAASREPRSHSSGGAELASRPGAGASLERADRERDAAMEDVRDTLKNILYHDDSNVSLEQQVNELNKNKAQHDLAIAVLRSQFDLLRAAISERT